MFHRLLSSGLFCLILGLPGLLQAENTASVTVISGTSDNRVV